MAVVRRGVFQLCVTIGRVELHNRLRAINGVRASLRYRDLIGRDEVLSRLVRVVAKRRLRGSVKLLLFCTSEVCLDGVKIVRLDDNLYLTARKFRGLQLVAREFLRGFCHSCSVRHLIVYLVSTARTANSSGQGRGVVA